MTLADRPALLARLESMRVTLEQAHALINAAHMRWLHTANPKTHVAPWVAWMRQREAVCVGD